MKNTRKIISALMALAMVGASFTACGSEDTSADSSSKQADVAVEDEVQAEIEGDGELNALQQEASDEFENFQAESQAAADSRAAQQAAEEEEAQQEENYKYYELLNEEYEKVKDTLFNDQSPTLTDGKVACYYDKNERFYIYDIDTKEVSAIQAPGKQSAMWRYYGGYVYCEDYNEKSVYKMDESGNILKQIEFPTDDGIGLCSGIYVTSESYLVISTSEGKYVIDPDFTSCEPLPTLEIEGDHNTMEELTGDRTIIGSNGNTVYLICKGHVFAVNLDDMTAKEVATNISVKANSWGVYSGQIIGKYLLVDSYIYDLEAEQLLGYSYNISKNYHGGTYTTEDDCGSFSQSITRKQYMFSEEKVSMETREEEEVVFTGEDMKYLNSDNYTVLNDTYVIYSDDYGLFLYDYANDISSYTIAEAE